MLPITRILKREPAARGMSANRLALALRVVSGRITSILNGKRAISADTALRLAHHLGTSARFWMNLQTRYDLTVAERDHGARMPRRSTALRGIPRARGLVWFKGSQTPSLTDTISDAMVVMARLDRIDATVQRLGG